MKSHERHKFPGFCRPSAPEGGLFLTAWAGGTSRSSCNSVSSSFQSSQQLFYMAQLGSEFVASDLLPNVASGGLETMSAFSETHHCGNCSYPPPHCRDSRAMDVVSRQPNAVLAANVGYFDTPVSFPEHGADLESALNMIPL